MIEDVSFQRARAIALRFLSYRPRSEAEIRTRLRSKFQECVVERVVTSLAEHHLVDDYKFAQLWRDTRDSFSPRSGKAITRELISKGVAREIAEAAVYGTDDDGNAYRAGVALARRIGTADATAFRRKLWGYLRRRGFSESVTRHTIFRLWEEQKNEDQANLSEDHTDP